MRSNGRLLSLLKIPSVLSSLGFASLHGHTLHLILTCRQLTQWLRLLLAPVDPRRRAPEPILLVSACPTIGCADERVRFCVTFDPDEFVSRDRSEPQRKVPSGLGG